MRNGQNPDIEQVKDDEGKIDNKIKERILESRAAVNENENALFTQQIVEPDVEVPRQQAIVAWGHTVRRLIRDIEPLLRHEDIPNAEFYYNEKEIGSITLTPPDKEGYQFSMFANPEFDDAQLKQTMGLPRTMDPPKSKDIEIVGLRDVIEMGEVVSHTWTVYTEKRGAPPNWELMELQAQRIIPKQVYENAVRYVDEFLQNAGVGLNIGSGRHFANYSG